MGGAGRIGFGRVRGAAEGPYVTVRPPRPSGRQRLSATFGNSVGVAPQWRGRGIGLRLAARSLYVAGAFDETAIVSAIAGARERETKRQVAAVTARAPKLLLALGLTEHGDGLFSRLCSMQRPASVIEDLARA